MASYAEMLAGVADGLTARRAGSALAGGNYAGAMKELFRAGDINGGFAIAERQDAERATQERSRLARQKEEADATAKQLDFTLRTVKALKTARQQGADVLAAYDSFAPSFQQLGSTPEEIAQMRGLLASDPQALDRIEQIAGEQQRELEFRSLGQGVGIWDKNTGELIQRYDEPQRPVTLSRGQRLVDPVTAEVIAEGAEPEPAAPQWRERTNPDGSTEWFTLPGAGGEVPAGSAPVADIGEMEAAVLQIPGTVVTSAGRSGVQNAAAGGVANSYHLSGQARDFRIPAGMSSAQFAATVRQRLGPQWEVIDEGDAPGGPHVHVEPAGRRQAAPGAVRGDGPKPLGLTPGQQQAKARADRTFAMSLQDDFTADPEVVQFREVDNAYKNVKETARNATAAGDLSMLFAFMKMLDPTSVVREQEFNNAQNAAGIPTRILAYRDRLLKGTRLTPEQRRDFVNQAETIYKNRRGRFDTIVKDFTAIANEAGVDPRWVVGEASAPAAPSGSSQPSPSPPGKPDGVADSLWRSANDAQRTTIKARPLTGRVGTESNPYIISPRDPRQSLNNVPVGSLFMWTDGSVYRKDAK